MKTCPKCKKKHGTRKKVCDCGHSFASKGKGVEPGGWVNDPTKGMPKLSDPGPLPSGKVSNAEMQDQIAYEGLGYCLWDYIPAERIASAKLRALWRKARKAMQDIVEHLDA